MSSPSPPLAITGWGVLSPIGIGCEPFAEGLRSGRSGRRTLPANGKAPLPYAEACTIPEFDAPTFLGSKGTRVLDRTTALAVTATGMALRHSGLAVDANNDARIGVVMGTSNGSMRSTAEYTRETLVAEKPYLVSAELFPNTVMNCAAGQSAIWHRLRGPNTTVSGGRLSGLLVLRYASRALRRGYADGLVAGGVEEFCEQSAWGAFHAARRCGYEPPILGEGSAMFTIEPSERARTAGRPVHAELLACEVGVYAADGDEGRHRQAIGLATCIRRALERAGVARDDVWSVSTRESGLPELDAVERRGHCLALGTPARLRRLAIGLQVGECFSASGPFQLAALLACFAHDPDASGRIGLVTSVGHGGAVGCAVLRGA